MSKKEKSDEFSDDTDGDSSFKLPNDDDVQNDVDNVIIEEDLTENNS